MCNILLVSSLLSHGFSTSAVLPIVFLLTGAITLVLSFKYGISAITPTDLIAAGVAGLAIAGWLIAGSNAAVIGTNVAQFTALIATFNKLRQNPGTEDVVSWSMGGSAALLSLIAVLVSSPAGSALNVYSLVLPVRCVFSCIAILTLAYVQYRAVSPAPKHHSLALASLQTAVAKAHHHFDLAA